MVTLFLRTPSQHSEPWIPIVAEKLPDFIDFSTAKHSQAPRCLAISVTQPAWNASNRQHKRMIPIRPGPIETENGRGTKGGYLLKGLLRYRHSFAAAQSLSFLPLQACWLVRFLTGGGLVVQREPHVW